MTQDQRRGVKAATSVVMLVLFQCVLLMAARRPVMDFGTESVSVLYGLALAIYVPVMTICLLAYRRLKRG